MQKRYWLQWGTIALIVNVFLILFHQIINPSNSFESPAVLLVFLQRLLTEELFSPHSLFAFITLSSIEFFVIGGMLGWLYGKIKTISQHEKN